MSNLFPQRELRLRFLHGLLSLRRPAVFHGGGPRQEADGHCEVSATGQTVIERGQHTGAEGHNSLYGTDGHCRVNTLVRWDIVRSDYRGQMDIVGSANWGRWLRQKI